MSRGIRSIHPRLPKCRLSSPAIVGTANVAKRTSRETSNRSMALRSPSDATCSRSSSGSPFPTYRRAKLRASGSIRSTSSARAARSPSSCQRRRSVRTSSALSTDRHPLSNSDWLSNGADTASNLKGGQPWSWRVEPDFLPSNMAVVGGQTVSATRFAQLTGVSRERLRTWERRYGFPAPQRVADGPRRYAVDDVGPVVAVRQAAGAGVPLGEAIARVQAGATAAPPPASPLAALGGALPVPVVSLSGPEPMRIEYVTAPLRSLPDGPRPGCEL